MTAEDAIQLGICEFLRWAARTETVWFAVPNGLPSKPRSVERFKRLGMRPGVADLCVIVEGKAHFLEIKTPIGIQSRDQRAFELHCGAAGCDYKIARSVEEAQAILKGWRALRGSELRRVA